MGPANRSRGRGRGGFRGGARGRGRGRGGVSRGGGTRGGTRGGPRPRRFQGQRLDDNDESESESKPDESDEDDDLDDGSSDEDDAPSGPATRPYLALLQSFTESEEGPRAKKRKLSYSQSNDRIDPPAEIQQDEEDEDSEADSEESGDQEEHKDVDLVVEPEEDLAELEDDGIDVQEQELSEDEEDATDPYDTHFATPDEQATAQRIGAIEKDGWETKRMPSTTARVFVTQPAQQSDLAPKDGGFGAALAKLESLKLKQKLRESSAKKMDHLDEIQQQLAPALFNYNDILFCDRGVKNGDSLRKLVCLHAINHIYKTRDRIIKNNNKLAKDGEANPDLEFRDQGFTRPKVLFLVPTRNACLRVVNTIRDLVQPDQQENRKRFDDAFTSTTAINGQSADKFGTDKPDDFRDLFAGNDDDMFRIGVKFTRKTLKYYSQFYNSDILLASPLGLRMAIGADDGPRTKKTSAKLDFDFLSSVELVVMDQADALLMQNWEHVDFIFEHLNLQPRDAHGCDFSRVRSWYLDDRSKFFRQTVVLSAFNTPELSELVRTRCHNWAGKLRVQPPSYPGVISHLGGANIKLRQTFGRFVPSSPAADPDARFAYFTSAVLPSLARRAADAVGTLIFVPSYLDFVRLRNYLATAHEVEALSFGTLSEYADVPAASRARSHFSVGRHKLLLYTERAHHFRRYKIRGVRRAIFYGLPDNPAFYADIAGSFMAASEADGTVEPGRGVVRAVFSKYDVLKLERIVGTERVGRMISDRGDTFDFV